MGSQDETRINNIDKFVLGDVDWRYLQDLQFLFYVWMGLAMNKFNQPTDLPKPKTQQQFYDELRNKVIEEVAKEIEFKFRQPFGKDTLDSFALYIRRMKK